jgi:hypothetical protein
MAAVSEGGSGHAIRRENDLTRATLTYVGKRVE